MKLWERTLFLAVLFIWAAICSYMVVGIIETIIGWCL